MGLVLLLDASGSMHSQVASVVGELNALLTERLALPPSTALAVYRFNKHVYKLRNTTLGEWQPLEPYETEGETALYDALCYLMDRHPQNTTFVIVTDGRDTASSGACADDVAMHMELARTEMGCSFILIGQGDDMERTAREIGITTRDLFVTQPLSQLLQSQSVADAISQSIKY